MHACGKSQDDEKYLKEQVGLYGQGFGDISIEKTGSLCSQRRTMHFS